ncbi:hypothetical protein OROHE_027205 [Orobanche hederae]
MASWNSVHLEVLYNVLGWVAFVSWSISFYPQVILNFRRKSVVGLNFDFLMLNLTKHSSYLIYNASLFFSSTVRRQYHERFGFNELIPVAANDVAFSMHAVLLTAFTLFQVAIYDKWCVGTRKSLEFPSESFLLPGYLQQFVCVSLYPNILGCGWYPSASINIQVVMTIIKYIPQLIENSSRLTRFPVESSDNLTDNVIKPISTRLDGARVELELKAILNFRRKSTIGFSIGNILLDFLGGVTNYCQMVVQSIDQNSWVNFYGNIGKTMISLVSIFFDILFIIQHYVQYRHKKDGSPSDPLAVSKEQLLQTPHSPHSDNV